MSSPARIIAAEDLDDSDAALKKGGGGGGRNGEASTQPGAVPMVPVRAPSNLPGNYTFDAVHEGVVFPVTVPDGGVRAGQTFMVPFAPSSESLAAPVVYAVEAVAVEASERTPLAGGFAGGGSHVVAATVWESNGATYGRWKDGLCDCCSFGCCHPSLLNAICFPQLLMGQILTRMKMTYCGNPARGHDYKRTFHTLVVLTLTYWVIWFFFHCPDGECESHHKSIVMRVTNGIWFVYTFVVMIKLRKAVRNKYKIPETRCHGCEDCCCVLFCGCCTVSQLARQTADYNQRRALCCSDTGLPEEPPMETALIV